MRKFLLALLFVSYSTKFSLVKGKTPQCAKPSESCSHYPQRGKIVVGCAGRNFCEVPSKLSSNVRDLDLSNNRIRFLESKSFVKYSGLEILNLENNKINVVAEDAFDPLQSLEKLFLSENFLPKVPSSLFRLPNLRVLDLSYNNNIKLESAFSNAPLTNRLEWLLLTNCYLNQLPPLHRFPHLAKLNISGNDLKITAMELAPMCNLKELDLGNTVKLLSSCDCMLLAQWGIRWHPYDALNCKHLTDAEKAECHSSNSTQEAQMMRDKCFEIVQEQRQQAYTNKVLLSVGIAGAVLLGISSVLFIYCRRRKRKRIVNNNTNSSNGKIQSDPSDTSLLPHNQMQNGTGDLISPAAKNSEDHFMNV